MQRAAAPAVLLVAIIALVVLGSLVTAAAAVHVHMPPCALADEPDAHGEVPLPTVQTQLRTTYDANQLWKQTFRSQALPGWVDGIWDGMDALLGHVRSAQDVHRVLPHRTGETPPMCTLLLSPDGIFSHYTEKDTVLASNDSGLFFSGPPTHCWPRHIRKTLPLTEALALMLPGHQRNPRIALMANYDTVRYLRVPLPPASVLNELGVESSAIQQVAALSLYVSDQGALTNFHWDGRPGLLQQFHGRKRLWLVHPQYSAYLAHPESTHTQCQRRSRFTGREERPMIPHWSLVVHPGQTVFIPARWWHQVESLDQPTIGAVVRFM